MTRLTDTDANDDGQITGRDHETSACDTNRFHSFMDCRRGGVRQLDGRFSRRLASCDERCFRGDVCWCPDLRVTTAGGRASWPRPNSSMRDDSSNCSVPMVKTLCLRASTQDRQRATDFAAKAREKMSVSLDPKSRNRAFLIVGNEDWPFPIPIVKRGGAWSFDAAAGKRSCGPVVIGSNELDAIQIARGYVEAQHEYALRPRQGYEVNRRRNISSALRAHRRPRLADTQRQLGGTNR